LLNERLDGLPAIFIHRNAERFEATIFVRPLELDKPGNLKLARTTPSGPKIEQNDLSFVIGKLDGGAVGIGQGEIRSGFAVLGRRCRRAHRQG